MDFKAIHTVFFTSMVYDNLVTDPITLQCNYFLYFVLTISYELRVNS